MIPIDELDADEIHEKLIKLRGKRKKITFKSQVELCELLDIKYEPLRSGYPIDRFLSSMCKRHRKKKSSKIIVTEIYDDYKERLEKGSIVRKERKNIDIKKLQNLLIFMGNLRMVMGFMAYMLMMS